MDELLSLERLIKHWNFLQGEFSFLSMGKGSRFMASKRSRNGYICPETYNPADFLIGTLAIAPGSENASQKSVNRLCDQYAVSEFAGRINVLINFEMHMMECEEFHDTDYTNYQHRTPLWPKKMLWLCHRTLLTIARDPTIQTLRIIQKIVRASLCLFLQISPFFLLPSPGYCADGWILLFRIG